MRELLDEAKARPGKLTLGTIAVGSTQHLSAELFKTRTGIDVLIVPYKGSPAVLTALRAGEIDAAFEILGPMLPQLQAKAVRALAVTSDQRFDALPEVPTMVQAGVADYERGLVERAGRAGEDAAGGDRPAQRRRQRGAEDARGARRLLALGVRPQGGTPQQLATLLAGEIGPLARGHPRREDRARVSRADRGMDLKQLEYFVQVAEFGSFTLSSRFLRVAQPALSRQVRALEVELRQTLFQRNGRGVTLTEPGKRLLEHARGILQQVQRARLDLEQQRGAVIGPAGHRPAAERQPHAHRAAGARLPRALSAGQLRRGRRPVRPPDGMAGGGPGGLRPGLQRHAHRRRSSWRRCAWSRCTWWARGRPSPAPGWSAHRSSLAQVAATELVIPPRPHSIRMLLDSALADAGLKARVALEIESVPTILDLVQHDGFHAVLTLNAIRRSGNEGRFQVRPIGKPRLVATLRLATSAQRPAGPLMEQAIALVKELVAQHWA